MLKAIVRAEGVQVNQLNSVVMDEGFLMYAVREFSRYATSLDEAIINYNQGRSGKICGNTA